MSCVACASGTASELPVDDGTVVIQLCLVTCCSMRKPTPLLHSLGMPPCSHALGLFDPLLGGGGGGSAATRRHRAETQMLKQLVSEVAQVWPVKTLQSASPGSPVPTPAKPPASSDSAAPTLWSHLLPLFKWQLFLPLNLLHSQSPSLP